MDEIPDDVLERRDAYCQQRAIEIVDLRGYGVDGYVWQTTNDNIVKVARSRNPFLAERAVYLRLSSHLLYRLQGFSIPCLIDSDESQFVLELSYVSPPYILDFAAATLDQPPQNFDPNDPAWVREKSGLFGARWSDVQRLLDALRQYGVHYTDVTVNNIRV